MNFEWRDINNNGFIFKYDEDNDLRYKNTLEILQVDFNNDVCSDSWIVEKNLLMNLIEFKKILPKLKFQPGSRYIKIPKPAQNYLLKHLKVITFW